MPADGSSGRLWLTDYVSPSHRALHAVERVLASGETKFQSMQIVETSDFGRALVLDGSWQSATSDEFIYHESLVHPAMLAARSRRSVLVLGGGEGATSREVLRWKAVQRVVMVDIDAEVVTACREHLPQMSDGAFDDPRHELVIGNAEAYVQRTRERWDVVISDLSDPIEDGPAYHLFSREYFAKARALLAPGGCFAVQAGATSPCDLPVHGRLIHTVASVFPHVRSYQAFVPSFCAPWGFILAAEHPLALAPDPELVDATLAAGLSTPLRYLDGQMLRAGRQLPPYMREVIDASDAGRSADEPSQCGASG